MVKKVIVREYVEYVRKVEVPVEIPDETEESAIEKTAYIEAVNKLQEVGMSPRDVTNAGMRLIHDFELVEDSSDYEPEFV